MPPFFEGVFFGTPGDGFGRAEWRDSSDNVYFVFESAFGAVKLRKRSAYPATFARAQASRLAFGYGDPALGHAITAIPLGQVTEDRFYGHEFLFIEADAAAQTVTVQRDAFSTLAIFAGIQPDRLVLSNHFDRVCQLIDPALLRVDRVALVELLCGLETHDRTLCQTVKVLYDRRRLVWTPTASRLLSPPPALVSAARKQKTNNVKEWRARLETTLGSYYRRYVQDDLFACELSGGMDSSLVVGYLRDQGRDPQTITMLLEGPFGETQAQKLALLHQRFNIKNNSVALRPGQHHAFDFLMKEGERPFYHLHTPPNGSVQDELLQELANDGITCLFTGHGGDELCENVPDESILFGEKLGQQFARLNDRLQPWQTPTFIEYFNRAAQAAGKEPARPTPLLSISLTNHGADILPTMVDYNIWPVSPLADPRLYLYCQGLPIRYRHSRNLSRMYLQARRFPPAIYNGPKEHFAEHHFLAVIQHLEGPLRYYLERSVLAANGLIQPKTVLDMFAQAQAAGVYSPQIAKHTSAITRILIAEINLQVLGLTKL